MALCVWSYMTGSSGGVRAIYPRARVRARTGEGRGWCLTRHASPKLKRRVSSCFCSVRSEHMDVSLFGVTFNHVLLLCLLLWFAIAEGAGDVAGGLWVSMYASENTSDAGCLGRFGCGSVARAWQPNDVRLDLWHANLATLRNSSA